MGPTDPEEAKNTNPDSLRALFGSSALENALHGSSDKEHALEEIKQVFGPVKILPGGKLEKAAQEGEGEGADQGETKEEGGEVKKDDKANPEEEEDKEETPAT